jgi:hypothetical protein
MARFFQPCFTIHRHVALNVSLTLGAAARKAPVAETLRKARTRKGVPVLVLCITPKYFPDEDSTIQLGHFAIGFFTDQNGQRCTQGRRNV